MTGHDITTIAAFELRLDEPRTGQPVTSTAILEWLNERGYEVCRLSNGAKPPECTLELYYHGEHWIDTIGQVLPNGNVWVSLRGFMSGAQRNALEEAGYSDEEIEEWDTTIDQDGKPLPIAVSSTFRRVHEDDPVLSAETVG